MTAELSDALPGALHERLDPLDVPPADLAEVRRRGRVLRVRRRRAVGAVGGGVLVALVGGGLLLGLTPEASSPPPSSPVVGVSSVGPLDLSGGLRAYADPGFRVHLGGRSFPAGQIEAIDTDAAATASGVVSYLGGRPVLLDQSGVTRPLEPEAEPSSFSPTAKADAGTDDVAYGAVLDGEPTVVVRDLATEEVVGRRVVDPDTVIDALDDGRVALRGTAGTSLWDAASGEVLALGGPRTRVADLRDGVLLYDGPRPSGPGAAGLRRLVPGAIDSQLTFDGEHVLTWSSTLRPTGDRRPIVLDEGPATPREGYAFWTIDTDGSVLLADPGSPVTVWDCEVPSGACVELGPLSTRGGDPAFIGNDQ